MKRDEEIEAAARDFLEKDDCPFTSYFEHFLYGAKWADSHPSPEVVALVEALGKLQNVRKLDSWAYQQEFHPAMEAVMRAFANFQKSRGGK